MAEIIPFVNAGRLVPRKRNVSERSASVMADVIMFTGVRYERLEAENCAAAAGRGLVESHRLAQASSETL